MLAFNRRFAVKDMPEDKCLQAFFFVLHKDKMLFAFGFARCSQ